MNLLISGLELIQLLCEKLRVSGFICCIKMCIKNIGYCRF